MPFVCMRAIQTRCGDAMREKESEREKDRERETEREREREIIRNRIPKRGSRASPNDRLRFITRISMNEYARIIKQVLTRFTV
jgi:hypothetical protein